MFCFVLSQSLTGRDQASRNTAQGALSYFWNLGLMSRDPDEPNQQIMATSSALTPTSPEDPTSVMIASSGELLLKVALPHADHNRNQSQGSSPNVVPLH